MDYVFAGLNLNILFLKTAPEKSTFHGWCFENKWHLIIKCWNLAVVCPLPLSKFLATCLVEEYAENAVGQFTVQEARQFGISDSVTAKFYELLKKSRRGSVLNKLAQSCLISCPHSMITQRAVKHHSFLKTELRSSMPRSTVNQTLLNAQLSMAQKLPSVIFLSLAFYELMKKTRGYELKMPIME